MLPLAQNAPFKVKTSTSQERNPRRNWNELPAALEQIAAQQGLIGEFQPSSFQSLSVPKAQFSCTVPVVLGRHMSHRAGNSPLHTAEGEKGFS